MINFDGEQVSKEFEASFGKPLSSLTAREMWWLVKFGKHIRGRCRSNVALNNYLNRNFRHLQFRQVDKTGRDGRIYPGLEISGVGDEADSD